MTRQCLAPMLLGPLAGLMIASAAACSSDAPAPVAPAAPMTAAHSASVESAATQPQSSAPQAAAPAAAGDRTKPKPLPTVELAELRQVVAEAVVSVGVDTQKGRAAALGKGVRRTWMDAGDGWKELPIPKPLTAAKGERDEARIYFGRDNFPRIMGARATPAGPRQLYLRFRHGAWKEWPRELASFAGKPHAALYGVLGWDDPEVVCKVGAFCLIKQRSGWTEVPLPVAPPATAVRVDLGADGAYVLLERQLLRLHGKRWQQLGGEGSWRARPASAWMRGDAAWVSEPSADALHQLRDGSWQPQPSPVRAPLGLWSHAPGRLWVVGQDGGAYFDGTRWRRIAGLEGPLSDVIGHGGRIWFGGESGLWQARLPS